MARTKTPVRIMGEDNASAKLTEQDVVSVRERVAGGETRASVAKDLGLAASTVNRIASGDHWPHVGGPRSTGGQGKPKLTQEQVDSIRSHRAGDDPPSQAALAEEYGVSQACISAIDRFLTWAKG